MYDKATQLLAFALIESRTFDQAQGAISLIAESNPFHPIYFVLQVRLFAALGRVDEACNALHQMNQYSTPHPSASMLSTVIHTLAVCCNSAVLQSEYNGLITGAIDGKDLQLQLDLIQALLTVEYDSYDPEAALQLVHNANQSNIQFSQHDCEKCSRITWNAAIHAYQKNEFNMAKNWVQETRKAIWHKDSKFQVRSMCNGIRMLLLLKYKC